MSDPSSESSSKHRPAAHHQTFGGLQGHGSYEPEASSSEGWNTPTAGSRIELDGQIEKQQQSTQDKRETYRYQRFENPSNHHIACVRVGYSFETALLGPLYYLWHEMYGKAVTCLLIYLCVFVPIVFLIFVFAPVIATILFPTWMSVPVTLMAVILFALQWFVFAALMALRSHRDLVELYGKLGWRYLDEVEIEGAPLAQRIVHYTLVIAALLLGLGMILMFGPVCVRWGVQVIATTLQRIGAVFSGVFEVIVAVVSFIDRISLGNVPSTRETVGLRFGNFAGFATGVFVYILSTPRRPTAMFLITLALMVLGGVWVACFGYLWGLCCLIIGATALKYLQLLLAKYLGVSEEE